MKGLFSAFVFVSCIIMIFIFGCGDGSINTPTSDDDMMIEETLYFLREYQQSNRCKDESGMQNSISCEKWLKSLKERIGG